MSYIYYKLKYEAYEKKRWNSFGTITTLKAFFLQLSLFPENHFFPLGGKRTNVYWKELHFTWFFYIPMATQNNSRNDWLNKNGHDYLLSHRTETGWDSIKNVFEVTVHCENASTINRSVREMKKITVWGPEVCKCEAGHWCS